MSPGASALRTVLPFKAQVHTHTHTHTHRHMHTMFFSVVSLPCLVRQIHTPYTVSGYSSADQVKLLFSNRIYNISMKFQFINFSWNNKFGVHFWFSQYLLGI